MISNSEQNINTKTNVKYLQVIVPFWDDFLNQIYKSIIYRNANGIKTLKYDLSNSKSIYDFCNILVAEYQEIWALNKFQINSAVFCQACLLYYKTKSATIANNIACGELNVLMKFNQAIFEKYYFFEQNANDFLVVIPSLTENTFNYGFFI